MQGGVVEEDAVGLFLVFTQAFAMVADDDDERVAIPAVAVEEAEELAEGGVGVGNLAVVGPAAVLDVEGRGGLVRRSEERRVGKECRL